MPRTISTTGTACALRTWLRPTTRWPPNTPVLTQVLAGTGIRGTMTTPTWASVPSSARSDGASIPSAGAVTTATTDTAEATTAIVAYTDAEAESNAGRGVHAGAG